MSWNRSDDSIHIRFNSMEFLLKCLIFMTDAFEVWLEYDIHRVEKQWYIEDCISHSENLPCYGHRHEVTESDRCSGDNREIECIKIAHTNWESCLKSMDQNRSNEPWDKEYYSNIDELFVVNM